MRGRLVDALKIIISPHLAVAISQWLNSQSLQRLLLIISSISNLLTLDCFVTSKQLTPGFILALNQRHIKGSWGLTPEILLQ